MNQAHSFPPVEIGGGAPATAAADDGDSLRWLAFPGIALIAAAAALLVLRDRRRRGPGQQPQAA